MCVCVSVCVCVCVCVCVRVYVCVRPQCEGQFTFNLFHTSMADQKSFKSESPSNKSSVFSRGFSDLTFSENTVFGFISQSFLNKIVESRNRIFKIFTQWLTH